MSNKPCPNCGACVAPDICACCGVCKNCGRHHGSVVVFPYNPHPNPYPYNPHPWGPIPIGPVMPDPPWRITCGDAADGVGSTAEVVQGVVLTGSAIGGITCGGGLLPCWWTGHIGPGLS